MHQWLGWSAVAVLSDSPHGCARIVGTVVGLNGFTQKGGDCNLRVACIRCRAYDPARNAVVSFGDWAAETVPAKAVFGAAYVIVFVSPSVRGGYSLRRHELWREHVPAN